MKKLLTLTLTLLLVPFSAFATTQIFMARSNASGNATQLNISPNLEGQGSSNVGGGHISVAGTLSNMHAYVSADPGGSASWTVTLQIGATLQNITCTINAGSTSCADTTHTYAVAAADSINIAFIPNSSPTAAFKYMTIQFTPTTANEMAIFAGAGASGDTTLEDYVAYAGQSGISSTEALTTVAILPEGGTFQDMVMTSSSGLSSGSFTGFLRNFSANATSSITCSVTASSCTDTTHTYATSSPASSILGDLLDFGIVPSSPSAARAYEFPIGFIPNGIGDFFFPSFITGETSTSLINYIAMLAGSTAHTRSTTESDVSTYADAMTITQLSVLYNTTFSAGKSRQFAIRDNSATTTASCTISSSSNTVSGGTYCIWNGSLSVAAGDLIDIADAPAGSPTLVGAEITIVARVLGVRIIRLRGHVRLHGHVRFIQ